MELGGGPVRPQRPQLPDQFPLGRIYIILRPPAPHVTGVAGPAALRMPGGRAAAFRAVFPILMFHGKHAM